MRQTGGCIEVAVTQQIAQPDGAVAIVFHKTEQKLKIQFSVIAHGGKTGLNIDDGVVLPPRAGLDDLQTPGMAVFLAGA